MAVPDQAHAPLLAHHWRPQAQALPVHVSPLPACIHLMSERMGILTSTKGHKESLYHAFWLALASISQLAYTLQAEKFTG